MGAADFAHDRPDGPGGAIGEAEHRRGESRSGNLEGDGDQVDPRVAYASLGELLEDYRDYLDVRDADEWTPDHPYARRLSNLCRTPGANYETLRKGIEHPDDTISANVLAGLCRVTMHLLEGQMERLERDFVQEGGLRERMRQARLEFRRQVEEMERQRAREREGRRDGRRDERDARDKRD